MRWQGPGGIRPPGFFLTSLYIFLFSSICLGQLVDKRVEVEARRKVGLLRLKSPYVPQKVDYSVELGSFWDRQSLYWLGASLEQNIGKCLFLSEMKCQQFLGAHVASSGREGVTLGLYQASLRWQFVLLPKTYSPFVRFMGGALVRNQDGPAVTYGTASLGFGVTMVLTPVVDLRLEARGGVVQEQIYGVGFLGFHVKTERFIEVFAKRLKDLGIDLFSETAKGAKTLFNETQKGAETLIEETTKGVESVIEIPRQMMRKKDQKPSDSNDIDNK